MDQLLFKKALKLEIWKNYEKKRWKFCKLKKIFLCELKKKYSKEKFQDIF